MAKFGSKLTDRQMAFARLVADNCLFTEGPAEAEPVQWVPAVGERVGVKIVPGRLGTVTRILGEPPWVWVAWDEGYEAEYTPNQLEPSLEAAPTPVLEEAPAPAPITPLIEAVSKEQLALKQAEGPLVRR